MDLPHASYQAKLDRRPEIEDTAQDFIEQEVGHWDFANNWPKFKSKFKTQEDLKNRVRAWLQHIEVDHDPEGIVHYLDGLASAPGKWR